MWTRTGVHGIFHIASPVNFNLRTFDDVVIPALKGTEALLDAALEAGPQLESVVFTSSVAAVVDGGKTLTQKVFDEDDFASTAFLRTCEARESGERLAPETLYAGSKIAAEKAVWDFRNGKQVRSPRTRSVQTGTSIDCLLQPTFSLSVVIPGVVTGPLIFPPVSAADLGVSLKPVFDIFAGKLSTVPPTIGSGCFVDVRDIAFMHLWAFEHPDIADGERYIGVAGYGATQACADILRKHYPRRLDKIPMGLPGHGYKGYVDGRVERVEYPDGRFQISGDKAQKAMGIKWVTMQESVLDTVESFNGLV